MGIINKDGWRFRDFRAAMYNSEKKDWLKLSKTPAAACTVTGSAETWRPAA